MKNRLAQSFLYRVFALALVVAGVPSLAFAEQPNDKLDAVLKDRASRIGGWSRVIVEFVSEPDSRVFGRGTGGRKLGQHAQVGEVENTSLNALASDPRVLKVWIDRPVVPTVERTGNAVGSTLARDAFGVSGRGVGVAVIDSGITAFHDDLYDSHSNNAGASIVHFKDFTTSASGNNDRPSDDFGHGTHVAGIIAGSGADSDGRRTGIAPGANLVGLKVLDAFGQGYISDVIAAIDYAIANKSAFNIRVINLSVAAAPTESYFTDPLTLAAQRATQAGIVFVASAGNLGRNDYGQTQFGGITAPGNAPWVLTVGASSHNGTARRSDDSIAAFSSRGPTWIDFAAKPDVLAPGVGIESLADPKSTLYGLLGDYLLDGTQHTPYKPYLSLSGTSMAAPVVAGAVALMLEANPSLTPNAVKALLQYTAQTLGDGNALEQGAGLLNVQGAVRLAKFFANGADFGVMSDTVDGEVVPWSRNILWGNYLVTGGLPTPDGNAWSLDLSWGALTTPSGSSVVWGTNIVWSTRADGNIVWSTARNGLDQNIVWSTAGADQNIVWSTGRDRDGNIVWSTARAVQDGNIVWSTRRDDGNIVWSTGRSDQNIVWSTRSVDGNIVWSTAIVGNVVWETDCGGRNCRNVRWGDSTGDIVWGTARSDM